MRKLILTLAAVLLIAALLAFAVPVMALDVDVGAAGVLGVSAAPAVDLVTFDVSAPAPAPVVTLSPAPALAPAYQNNEWSLWVALSAILLTTAIACRRNLLKMLNNITGSRRRSDCSPERTKVAGGPRDGILPAAA